MDLYRVLRVSIYLIVVSGAFAISLAEQNVTALIGVVLFGGVIFKLLSDNGARVRQEFFFAMMLALAVYNFWPPREADGLEHLPLAAAKFLLSVQALLFVADCRPGMLLTFCGTSTLCVILISGVIQGDATVLLRMACLVGLTAWTLFVYSLWRTREGFVVGAQTVFGARKPFGVRPAANATVADAGLALPANAFWQGLTMTGAISCACLLLGLFLFFSAPRVNDKLAALAELLRGDRNSEGSGPPMGTGREEGNGTAPPAVGWDERLNVRSQAPIQNNQQYAMTVTFSVPPATLADINGRIYFRGLAYSDSDDGVWTAPASYQKMEARPNEAVDVIDPSVMGVQPRLPEIRQFVVLTTVSHVYFGIAPVIRVGVKKVDIDMEGGLREANNAVLYRYELWSGMPMYEEQLPENAVAEHDSVQRYVKNTGLRVDIVDEVQALAQRITANAATPLEKARAILSYLRDGKHYKYTLKLDELHRTKDPIYEFLLSSDESQRRGHCQYFASAFVVLCRLSGIPARLASGFAAQAPVSSKVDSIVVKNADAHTWGEVYFKGIGWVPFDPVPYNSEVTGDPNVASNPAPTSPSISPEPEKGLVDSAWRRVLGYNSAEQRKVYKHFGDVVNVGFGNAGSTLSGRGWGGWAGAVLCWIALSVIFSWLLNLAMKRARKRPVKTGSSGQRARAAVAFYNDLLQVLSRRGFVRRTGQTPREFAEFVVKRGGAAFQPAQIVTEVFENVRYGGEDLSQEEFNRLQTALDSLRELTFTAREG